VIAYKVRLYYKRFGLVVLTPIMLVLSIPRNRHRFLEWLRFFKEQWKDAL
jgi:hypothetical protein